MVIKKHKPSLQGVLTRRRTSVAEYFENLGVRTHEQLVTVLEALLGTYRVSEELQEEAFAWVTTLKKPQAIPQKEEKQPEAETPEVEKEKPKKPSGRSMKTSTPKKRSTKSRAKKRSTKTSTEPEEK